MSKGRSAGRRPKRISTWMLPENLRLNLRIAAKIPVGMTSPCWEWIGRLNRNGYGRAWHKGREPVAHRAVYEEIVGPIARGLVLDHRCRVRHCCNPQHLEPVTVGTNTRRGQAVLFAAAVKLGVPHA